MEIGWRDSGLQHPQNGVSFVISDRIEDAVDLIGRDDLGEDWMSAVESVVVHDGDLRACDELIDLELKQD